MTDQFCFCPICHTRKVNVGGEGDDVDFTCDHCGGHFKAGEARRGRLYFEDELRTRRLASLEKRMNEVDKSLLLASNVFHSFEEISALVKIQSTQIQTLERRLRDVEDKVYQIRRRPF